MPTRRAGRIRSWRGTAVSHPRASAAYVMGRRHRAQDAMVLAAAHHLFDSQIPRDLWSHALAELDRGDLVPPNHVAPHGTTPNATLGRWIYAVVRLLKPETVIETGVAHGSSSWLILNALRKNDRGILHSIDLPGLDTHEAYNVVTAAQTGSMVPETLRDRWNLLIGDSSSELPKLLAQVDCVDVFFHDSDHSYRAMRNEFTVVVPRLRSGGVLVSDDVHKNAAFAEACRTHGLRGYVFRKGGAATPDD